MSFTDDEKLMLFLIWCHCEQCIELFDHYWAFENDHNLNLAITRWKAFREFLSEATQAKENFEFWVSDFDMEDIKNSVISNFPVLMNDKCKYFKNKITITAGG